PTAGAGHATIPQDVTEPVGEADEASSAGSAASTAPASSGRPQRFRGTASVPAAAVAAAGTNGAAPSSTANGVPAAAAPSADANAGAPSPSSPASGPGGGVGDGQPDRSPTKRNEPGRHRATKASASGADARPATEPSRTEKAKDRARADRKSGRTAE